jgi:bacterioferritin-associated ferredoxin
MIVCQCKGITDTTIRRFAADGVTTLAGIQKCTGAARSCAPCRTEVCRILNEEQFKTESTKQRRDMQVAA